MVEHQIICKILADKSLTILYDNGIDVDLFPADYRDELQFIIDHKNTYGNIPDTLTFLSDFQDFDIVEVSENEDYMIDKLMESILYQKQIVMANHYGEKLGEADSRNALRYLKDSIEEIKKIEQKTTTVDDITQDTARGDEYTKKVMGGEVVGISTGSEELDKALHGWLEEDLIIILGRTNEGKSWILKYFLVVAWQAGHKVMLYSGEMSSTIVGYRFDTLNEHFSNTALMSGSEELGEDMTDKTYVEYLGNLKNSKNPFIVLTPKTLGRKLDIPTLKYLIEIYKPDIVGIDQISLMVDSRAEKGDQTRIQYTHIAEDLYDVSEKYRIPVLAPAQANRSAEKKNKEKGSTNDNPPETHEISESDGIGQNATRVVSILRNGVQLKIFVAKNRYGERGQTTSFLWDIDRGIIKPFSTPTTNSNNNQVNTSLPPETSTDNQITSGEELF